MRAESGSAALLGLIQKVTDRLVRSLDFDHALATLIEGATELLGVDRGSILILDEESRTLSIRVSIGLPDEIIRSTRVRLGEGIAGQVAESGRPIALADVRRHPGWKSRSDPGGDGGYADFSALCVPLEMHGAVSGVMTFNQKSSGKPFDDGDLALAMLIANQASVVLYSAVLHRHFLDKQALEQELRIARAIQERLLPQAPPRVPGFRFAARQTMCHEVGGDYYDFLELPSGELAIAIGDVAGHGIGSALLATDARSALRDSLLRGEPVATCLEHLNDVLQADTTEEMYMTFLLGTLDPRRRRFTFASAGHHMPVLLRGSRFENLPAAGSNIPLGIRRGLRFGLEEPLELRPGDLLVLFTDGIWEATSADGHRFGTAGLERTLVAHRRRSEEEIVAEIFAAVSRHHEAAEPDDDRTLVVLRAT
ncbi:MAG: PP2C family protein-serine/threonine phosphatase [Thermoanaerobaculia bacterium]